MPRIVSAAIVILLLGLYVYAVWIVGMSPETAPSEPVKTILTLVGGLVSALVVAVLAITPPAGNPAKLLDPTPSTWVTYLTAAYLLVWLLSGAGLLIIWMRHPDASDVLVGAAKSWLGLAVAAGFAFFGLKNQG